MDERTRGQGMVNMVTLMRGGGTVLECHRVCCSLMSMDHTSLSVSGRPIPQQDGCNIRASGRFYILTDLSVFQVLIPPPALLPL